MSDEDMPELPDVAGLDDLLSAYREQTARSPDQVESALHTVTAQVGSNGATAAAGLSTGAKVGVAAALAGVVGVVAMSLGRPDPTPTPTPPPAPAVAATEARVEEPRPQPQPDTRPAPPTVEATPEPQPQAPPEPRPRARRPQKKPQPQPKPAPASTLAEELKRLQRARAALRSGNPARARALIDAHRADYPGSTLAPERDATEIAALCAEARVSDAEAKAEAFAKAYPGERRDLLADCDD